jgi:hypothetical protein
MESTRLRVIGAFVVAVSGAPVHGPDQDSSAVMVRLAPAMFRELSAEIQQYLRRRNCTIPQSWTNQRPHNVVRGRFTGSTDTDIAVLCSIGQTSRILVFRSGLTAQVAELAPQPDDGYLQRVDGRAFGFSRALEVATPAYIQEHYEAYGGPKPPPLNHDGINDIFVEKASVVWYWYNGRWLQLQGAD